MFSPSGVRTSAGSPRSSYKPILDLALAGLPFSFRTVDRVCPFLPFPQNGMNPQPAADKAFKWPDEIFAQYPIVRC
jgi:hypothetical protein